MNVINPPRMGKGVFALQDQSKQVNMIKGQLSHLDGIYKDRLE